jgi:hypothetical protein
MPESAAAIIMDFADVLAWHQGDVGLAVPTWLRATPTMRFVAAKRGTLDQAPDSSFAPNARFSNPPARII